MVEVQLIRLELEQRREPLDSFPESFVENLLEYYSEVSTITDGYVFSSENEAMICDKNSSLHFLFSGKGCEERTGITKALKIVGEKLRYITVKPTKKAAITLYYCVQLQENSKFSSKSMVNEKMFPIDHIPDSSFGVNINWKNEDDIHLSIFPFEKGTSHIHFCVGINSEETTEDIYRYYETKENKSRDYIKMFISRMGFEER